MDPLGGMLLVCGQMHMSETSECGRGPLLTIMRAWLAFAAGLNSRIIHQIVGIGSDSVVLMLLQRGNHSVVAVTEL